MKVLCFMKHISNLNSDTDKHPQHDLLFCLSAANQTELTFNTIIAQSMLQNIQINADPLCHFWLLRVLSCSHFPKLTLTDKAKTASDLWKTLVHIL